MDAQLRADIQAVLGTIATTAPVLSSGARTDKLYELFVLSCVLRALRQIGAQLETRDSDDAPTNSLTFRLAPGLIYNPASSPGFILATYQGRQFEVQNSLRVKGRSKILHELDVSLVTREEAERCRTSSIDPSQSAVRFLAECKYYGDVLPLHLGREFVGLCAEFTLRVKVMVSNQGSDEIHTLVTKHKGTENFGISPLDPGRVDIFVNWLANEFRQVLN